MIGKVVVPTLLVALACAGSSAHAKDPVVVTMDRAKVMRTSAPAATVIIGNPAIADATVHDRQTLILTGRMAGVTNLVVLDKKGEPIAEEIIKVEVSEQNIVFVQRGASRYSYACTPSCANTIRTGDQKDFFGDSVSQIGAVNQNSGAFSGASQGQ
jgi:hypothetical protein